MDYKSKYLKYKNKYLNLKKQIAGADMDDPPPPPLFALLPLLRDRELVMKCTFNDKIGLVVYQGEIEDRNSIISQINNTNYNDIEALDYRHPTWKRLILHNGIKIFLRNQEEFEEFKNSKKEFSHVVHSHEASQLFNEEIIG